MPLEMLRRRPVLKEGSTEAPKKEGGPRMHRDGNGRRRQTSETVYSVSATRPS